MKQFYFKLSYFIFLLLFFVGIWGVNIVCFILSPICGKTTLRNSLAQLVYRVAQLYIFFLTRSGALICNREILDQFNRSKEGNEGKGRVIISNHPSLLDAVIILSRLPRTICVFKSSLTRFILPQITADGLSYLGNNMGFDLIKELVEKLQKDETVLIFPEGTRTKGNSINSLNAGYALAALKAEVPIEIISIHSNSPLLSKKQALFKTIQFPAVYRLERGPTINPKDFKSVNAINNYIENWFKENTSDQNKPPSQFLPPRWLRESSEKGFTIQFSVPAHPFYCDGHMPEMAIVPAFVQLAWMHEILEKESTAKIKTLKHFNWKFIQPIIPLTDITVSFENEETGWRVGLKSNDKVLSKGRIITTHE